MKVVLKKMLIILISITIREYMLMMMLGRSTNVQKQVHILNLRISAKGFIESLRKESHLNLSYTDNLC